MSHTIHGYVAKHEDLLRVFGRAARLPQGLGFVPDSVHDDYDEVFSVSDKQEKTAIARIQQLAFVQTDFFGGGGTQSARLWENGKLVYEEEDSHGSPINAVLKRLGVKCVWPEGKVYRHYIDGDGKPVEAPPDEFDAVEFGRSRQNEDFAVVELPSEERLKRQLEWKKEQAARPSDQARAGDYIKLLVQWQDVSGIPLVTHPPGTVLKVLCVDLTSGGVVVECDEMTFSLTPDQYEITEPPDE